MAGASVVVHEGKQGASSAGVKLQFFGVGAKWDGRVWHEGNLLEVALADELCAWRLGAHLGDVSFKLCIFDGTVSGDVKRKQIQPLVNKIVPEHDIVKKSFERNASVGVALKLKEKLGCEYVTNGFRSAGLNCAVVVVVCSVAFVVRLALNFIEQRKQLVYIVCFKQPALNVPRKFFP